MKRMLLFLLVLSYSSARGAAQGETSQLIKAILTGCTKTVSNLLEQGYSAVGGSNYHVKQPIHHAAEKGYAYILTLLLDCGASITASTSTYRTVLHYAAVNGHAECLRFLLKRGAKKSIDQKIKNRNLTALDLALNNGHEECAQILRKFGAKERAVTPQNSPRPNKRKRSNSPHEPKVHNDTLSQADIVREADDNSRDSKRRKTLCYAIDSFDTLIYRITTEQNIAYIEQAAEWVPNFDVLDNCGKSPLIYAVGKDSLPYVKALIYCGADPWFQDSNGNTPFSYALSDEMKEFLLSESFETKNGPIYVCPICRYMTTDAEQPRIPSYYAEMEIFPGQCFECSKSLA